MLSEILHYPPTFKVIHSQSIMKGRNIYISIFAKANNEITWVEVRFGHKWQSDEIFILSDPSPFCDCKRRQTWTSGSCRSLRYRPRLYKLESSPSGIRSLSESHVSKEAKLCLHKKMSLSLSNFSHTFNNGVLKANSSSPEVRIQTICFSLLISWPKFECMLELI